MAHRPKAGLVAVAEAKDSGHGPAMVAICLQALGVADRICYNQSCVDPISHSTIPRNSMYCRQSAATQHRPKHAKCPSPIETTHTS